MTDEALLDAWRRRCVAVLDPGIRRAYLLVELAALPVSRAASVLDLLIVQSDEARPGAREVLSALVGALADGSSADFVQRLREEAVGRELPALRGLLRRPPFDGRHLDEEPPARVPEIAGRRLTLGERKALARRPSRAHFDALLQDPHPAVITNLLANPRLTEDDVVRLAAKRPGRAEVLSAIARHTLWTQRARVRAALVLNPATPAELAVPLVATLSSTDLLLVSAMTTLRGELRDAAREHLARRAREPTS